MDRINNENLIRLAQKEEPRFLSILLRDKDCLMETIAFGIKTGNNGHFWDISARRLYELIHSYFQKHNAVLTRTVIESIMDAKTEAGGFFIEEDDRVAIRLYWDKVYNINTPIEDFNFLLHQINNRYIQWQGYSILQKRIDEVSKATSNQDTLVKSIREEFYSIDGMEADPYSLVMNSQNGFEAAMKYVNERRDKPDAIQTVMCELKTIDDIFYGFDYGSYTIVTGMINGGKTTLMFNMAFNMAKRGYIVIYVSLEKKAIPLFTRLLSLHAMVDYNRIKRGGKGERGLDDFHYRKITEAANDLIINIKPNLYCIQMASGAKISKILAMVDRIIASRQGIREADANNISKKPVDVLFVDYLGALGHESCHPSRPDLDDAVTSQRLQAYGREKDLVTITAAQLKTPSSKDIRSKAKKASSEEANVVEVNTEDIAGSKMIVADADNAIGVILNSDFPPTKMFVHITKARDAESRRTVVLDFDGKIGRVSDTILEPGQVTAVDQLIYDKSVTEEKLQAEDDLFDNKGNDKKDVTESPATPTPLEDSKDSKETLEKVLKNGEKLQWDFIDENLKKEDKVDEGKSVKTSDGVKDIFNFDE